ncbi:MAG: hypothetical protein BIFFINMI_01873 [Phycisphaerae bacterium]|nr:hypothetical protein [Phycisphaerae bacterium]
MRTRFTWIVLAGWSLAFAGCRAATPAPGIAPGEAEAVRAWGLQQGWKELPAPADAEAAFKPSADDRARGWIAFTPPRGRLGPIDAMPTAAAASRGLSELAFPGAIESLCVGVHALKDTAGVDVEVSSLAGPNGSAIHGSAVQVREVIYAPLSRHTTRSRKNEFVMHPLWLIEYPAAAALAAGRSRVFWLNVRVPSGTKAGVYRGTITLHGGGTTQERPIELDVQPFALDGELCSWAPVTAGNGFDLELYRQLAEHYMTGLSWWWGTWGLRVTREGDRASFDPADLDMLNAATKSAGMRGPWILMLGNMIRGHLERRLGGYYAQRKEPPLFDVKLTPIRERKGGVKPDGLPAVGDLSDPEISRRYIEVIRALADRAKTQGYPQIIIIPYDEPTKYLSKWNAHWADLIRKEVPQIKVLNTPQGVYDWAKALMPHSDLMVVRGGDDPIYKLAIDEGRGIIGYGRLTADMTFDQARHAMGLRFAEQQPDVIFFWSLNYGHADERTPFNDLRGGDSVVRHQFAWPPSAPGRRWIETVAWEGQREGAKDYLLTLMIRQMLADDESPTAKAVRAPFEQFNREAARDAGDLQARRVRLVAWYRQLTGR